MRTDRERERGAALLTALLVLVTLVGLSFALLQSTMADHRESQFNREIIKATALAEAGTEIAHKALLVAAANYRAVPTGGTATVGGVDVPYVITPVGVQRVEVDAQGVQTIIQPYRVSANATSNGYTKHVEKIIDLEKTPIFQYVVFYNEDLEILPGPSMHLYGRIHSNHDIFIGCGSTLTLETEYLHAAGGIFRRRKNDITPTHGTVNIKVMGRANYVNMEGLHDFPPPSVSGFDSDFLGYDANGDGDYDDPADYENWTMRSLDLWEGTVQTAEHGVKQIETPAMGAIQMYEPAEGGGDYDYDEPTDTYYPVAPGTGDYEEGYFYGNADLVIIDGAAYDADGNEITVWPDVDGDGIGDSPISESTFYDGREDRYITTTDINLEILGESGYWPANGLLYAVDTSADASQPDGVRLVSGEVLAEPLTVVSPTPVFTLGDYNVGDDDTPKQGASIITDAYNILSNAWDDADKAPGHLPSATETTINAAFISGGYDTNPGMYNGGFENLPRFHEKWSGVDCHIRGSFVNIWDSDVAKGPWVYGGDNYTAPRRDWNYDTDFNDISKLPPFTPSVVGTTRVVWVMR